MKTYEWLIIGAAIAGGVYYLNSDGEEDEDDLDDVDDGFVAPKKKKKKKKIKEIVERILPPKPREIVLGKNKRRPSDKRLPFDPLRKDNSDWNWFMKEDRTLPAMPREDPRKPTVNKQHRVLPAMPREEPRNPTVNKQHRVLPAMPRVRPNTFEAMINAKPSFSRQ